MPLVMTRGELDVACGMTKRAMTSKDDRLPALARRRQTLSKSRRLCIASAIASRHKRRQKQERRASHARHSLLLASLRREAMRDTTRARVRLEMRDVEAREVERRRASEDGLEAPALLPHKYAELPRGWRARQTCAACPSFREAGVQVQKKRKDQARGRSWQRRAAWLDEAERVPRRA
jgi:hypothetical protein